MAPPSRRARAEHSSAPLVSTRKGSGAEGARTPDLESAIRTGGRDARSRTPRTDQRIRDSGAADSSALGGRVQEKPQTTRRGGKVCGTLTALLLIQRSGRAVRSTLGRAIERVARPLECLRDGVRRQVDSRLHRDGGDLGRKVHLDPVYTSDVLEEAADTRGAAGRSRHAGDVDSVMLPLAGRCGLEPGHGEGRPQPQSDHDEPTQNHVPTSTSDGSSCNKWS